MRIVLDTNVLVSALLTEHGAAAQVLTLLLGGELSLVFDARILAEYAEVLARPRFGFDPTMVDELLRGLEAAGERVVPAAVEFKLPDADDQPFLEVAVAGKAAAIVTGNLRHFPDGLGVEVLWPRALLDRLDDEQAQ